MTEGMTLRLSDNIHFATIIKVLNNQSAIIECKDKYLSFTRLIENDEIYRGIPFRSWACLLYRR
jgi:hypothetical protein